MLLNFHNATKSYTSMLLNQFSNLNIQINETDLYEIPIVYSNTSRLYKKLANTDQSFTYRTPIMSLEVNIDVSTSLARATNPMLKRKVLDIVEEIETEEGLIEEINKVGVTYNDKPTDFLGTITIIADTMTTLTNIVESINTMFYHNTLYSVYKTPLGEEINTPIKLENIEMNIDNNESEFNDNRLLEAVIELRVEGVTHSNYNTNGKRIELIDLYIHNYYKDIEGVIEHYSISDED